MNPINLQGVDTKEIICSGCTNKCSVLRFRFPNGNISYAGNKCEKVFFSKNSVRKKGYNAFETKNKILFTPSSSIPSQTVSKIRIGIPRVLNMYENFPFWKTLFEDCGIEVVISPESDVKLYQSGVGSVMSDNICFPAKLVQGHILSLIDSKVTRIFYPIVPKEYKEFTQANNSFNCPVVSGYPDVIRSAIDPQANYNIPFDTPVINFANEKALKSQCWDYLKVLLPAPPSKFFSKFSKDQKYLFDKAFEKAIFIRESWNAEFIRDQQNMLQKCINNGDLCFVVAGRPYHADPLVNQKVGQILSDLGVNVMTDDVFRTINEPRHTQKYTYKFTDKNSTNNNSLFDSWKNINFVSQWSYPNRVMQAAIQIAKLPVNIQLVQLNSFGCGPDSFLMDETGEILRKVGKNLTVLRIDEIASPGSIRLRCRSLIESLKTQEKYRETLA